MKRTLKRESKVLEIVRREAIGAGGSLYVPRLFSGVCLLGEPQDLESASPCLRFVFVSAQAMHSVWAASQHRLHVACG